MPWFALCFACICLALEILRYMLPRYFAVCLRINKNGPFSFLYKTTKSIDVYFYILWISGYAGCNVNSGHTQRVFGNKWTKTAENNKKHFFGSTTKYFDAFTKTGNRISNWIFNPLPQNWLSSELALTLKRREIRCKGHRLYSKHTNLIVGRM